MRGISQDFQDKEEPHQNYISKEVKHESISKFV